jgi:hypothetical protein
MLTLLSLAVLYGSSAPCARRQICYCSFEHADAVLPYVDVAAVGRVLDVRDTTVREPWYDTPNKARLFTIELSYGWRWRRNPLIEVLDPYSETDCGANLSRGLEVLIMAHSEAGHLTPWTCSPSGPIEDRVRELSRLGEPLFRR